VRYQPAGPARASSEGVDAAVHALYKTGKGGGRNPAAAVLWTTPSCEHLRLPTMASREHPENTSVDQAVERPAR